MTVSVRPLSCGSLAASRSFFESGADDAEIVLPVPAWLVTHPQGTVLFDTGMHADLTADTPMRETASLFFTVGCEPDDLVAARLRAADVDPTDVDVVVLSHLHFDHAGGLAQLPDARVLVQRAEWEAGTDPELGPANALDPANFDLGHDRVLADGEHDVFGDGRVVCLPTPGHTPGHQSLRVRVDSGTEVVLCGDCAYFERTLDGGALPPIGHDHDAQRTSIARLAEMRAGGSLVVPGHDAAALAALPEVIV